MKLTFRTCLGLGALLLGAGVGPAFATPSLAGHWEIDVAKSTPIRPWDREALDITVDGDTVYINRHLQWGRDRKVSDLTKVKADGTTVTVNPVTYWLDTWYNNVYIGGDHQKRVTGEWLDQGRILKLETWLKLEAQQGDYPVHLYDEYRLAPDGLTLMLFELRSTRDQPLVYVFNRRFVEPAGTVTTASGLKYAITHHGDGPAPQAGQVVIAHYTGTLVYGTVFDSSRKENKPFAFTLGRHQVIKGWDEGFTHLHVGDQATFIIPPDLAYGEKGAGDVIPPGATLKFDVEFVDLKPHALTDRLQDTMDRDGIEAALKQFVELRQKGFGDYYVGESQFNALGYRYLRKDKVPEAIAILKLGVELFPASGNIHDSLGEALLKNGQKDLALQEYREALALDPENENAAKVIGELTKAQ